MALTIRLSRIGTKGKPAYRIVVAEIRSRRDGAAVEQLGHYSPRTRNEPFQLNLERVDHWVRAGAKPSDTVASLIRKARRAAAAAPVAAAVAAPAAQA